VLQNLVKTNATDNAKFLGTKWAPETVKDVVIFFNIVDICSDAAASGKLQRESADSKEPLILQSAT
jgi:hypothetical protein